MQVVLVDENFKLASAPGMYHYHGILTDAHGLNEKDSNTCTLSYTEM